MTLIELFNTLAALIDDRQLEKNIDFGSITIPISIDETILIEHVYFDGEKQIKKSDKEAILIAKNYGVKEKRLPFVEFDLKENI